MAFPTPPSILSSRKRRRKVRLNQLTLSKRITTRDDGDGERESDPQARHSKRQKDLRVDLTLAAIIMEEFSVLLGGPAEQTRDNPFSCLSGAFSAQECTPC